MAGKHKHYADELRMRGNGTTPGPGLNGSASNDADRNVYRRNSLARKANRLNSKNSLHQRALVALPGTRTSVNSDAIYDRQRAELANMEDARLFSSRQLDMLGIVHPQSRNLQMVEAIRQLRTKLYSLNSDGNFSVLVTSVAPAGGGSFVALNLAATIAFDQSKTSLLIDANMNDPVLHKLTKLVGADKNAGLLDYLERPEIGIESIVHPSGISRMRIIPIGPQEGYVHEHFASARYRRLMNEIKSRYNNRFIIVDGPSIASSTDAVVLSEICDYTLLVVPYGGVTPGALDSMVDLIEERKLAGVVLNDQPN